MSKVLENAPLGAFCNTFDLHKVLSGLEIQFSLFLRVANLNRFTVFTNFDPLTYCVWLDVMATMATLRFTRRAYILPEINKDTLTLYSIGYF